MSQEILSFADLINNTNLEFTDISSEVYRIYVFPDGNDITITSPIALNVSRNGHRVLDGSGVSHYIPQGWIHLRWEVMGGLPHFVK